MTFANPLLKRVGIALLACGLVAFATPSRAAELPSSGVVPLCLDCISVRIGPATAVRGPTATEADNLFTETKLPNGQYRGFTANGTTIEMDGDTPSAMSGAAHPVLTPGPAESFDGCGQWLNHVEQIGGSLLGFIHDETACKYAVSQTWKSMSISRSKDYGMSWTPLGQFITGKDGAVPGKISGEGDCSVTNQPDGYLYAYCLRAQDWKIFVARAPASDPQPDQWMKYFQGTWSQPGRGGDATPLDLQGQMGRLIGGGATYWAPGRATLLLGQDKDGLELLVSSDHITFKALPIPLVPIPVSDWKRPAPTEFMGYPVLLDAISGSNSIRDRAYIVYTYLKPNQAFDKRYLVFQAAQFTLNPTAPSVQVALALPRWINSRSGERLSSTAPLTPDMTGFHLETVTGYLLTRPDPHAPSMALEECVTGSASSEDHVFAMGDSCSSGSPIHKAGWVYQSQRPGTSPLVQCLGKDQHHFLSVREDCEQQGTATAKLGFVLSN